MPIVDNKAVLDPILGVHLLNLDVVSVSDDLLLHHDHGSELQSAYVQGHQPAASVYSSLARSFQVPISRVNY